jgi:hypothetical protein
MKFIITFWITFALMAPALAQQPMPSPSIDEPTAAAEASAGMLTRRPVRHPWHPRVDAGTWALEASGSYTYGNSVSSTVLSPDVAYFFFDRVSLGPEGAVTWNDNGTAFNLGPIATWYFFVDEQWVQFVSAAYDWRQSITGQTRNDAGGDLGAKYFFNPTAAFGPVIKFRQPLSSDSNALNVEIAAQFSVHL